MKDPIDSRGTDGEPTVSENFATAAHQSNEESAGAVIGRYKLLEKIGEGGFGAVWMAEQREPVKRRVALKIVKLGMDTRQVVARFEAERQALALMDHPGIAKVLDAGATDFGRPYFVMELVRGIPITVYCDQNKLPTRERLDLSVQVCHAIQHAHQKGIIHRDIKPSNILVTLHDGVPVPKVIDFGIAKATQQDLTERTLFTRFQQFVGTPAYMSPEQAEMSGLDVDTRSDIYSLGVLLYELLTGRTPFDSRQLAAASVDEMRRIIREQEPVRPSTRLSQMAGDELTTTARRHHTEPPRLIHALKGDLDWVVMKCLEKDRTRRYQTANALAMDVQRHLQHEPVTARPPSQIYRLQKLIRRNRAVAVGTVAVALALITGLTVSSWMYWREREARQRAVAAEREQSRQRTEAEAARAAEAAARERAQRGEAAADAAARALAESMEVARLNLYVASLNIAERALAENDLRRAVEHLEPVRPKDGEEDLRGFEWYYLWEQCRRHDLFSLREPSGMIQAMDLSPDGRYVAAANMDTSVRIWDLQTRRPVLHLTNSPTRLFSVVYSPDGTMVAAADGSTSRKALVWDARTGELLVGPQHLPGAMRPVAFSRNSRLLITGRIESQNRRGFQVWSMPDAKPVMFFESSGADPLGTVVDRNRDQVIALYTSGTLQFWEGDPLQATGSLEAFSPAASQSWWQFQFHGMDLSTDGRWLALVAQDGAVQLWDVLNRRRAFELVRSGGQPWAVALSPDASRLVTAHADSSLQVWDTPSGRKLGTLRGHENEVFGLKFLPNSSRLVSCSKDHTIRMWDLNSLAAPVFATIPSWPTLLHFSPDGQRLALLYQGAGLEVWNVRDFSLVDQVPTDNWEWFRPPAAAARGDFVALRTTNSTVELWRPFDYQLLRAASLPDTALVAISEDAQWLASADNFGKLRIEQLDSGKLLAKLDTGFPQFAPHALAVLKSIGQVVISHATSVTIWDVNRQTPIANLPGHYDHIRAMVATLDEKHFVTATMDGAIKVWQTVDWTLLHDLHGHTGIIWDVAISPDGHTLASAGADNKIRLWNTRNWRLTQTLQTDGPVARLAFSPKGDSLATADVVGDVRIRLWHAPRSEK